MLKKSAYLLFTLVIAAMMMLPVFAAVFTDFNNYPSFNAGGNPVFNPGESVGDYWVGEWDGGDPMEDSRTAIEAGKGWNGTAALAVWEENNVANQGLYLFVTPANGIPANYAGAKYLRVWIDLTNVAFRKANFGVTDSHYNLFTTDEENSLAENWPFYYLPEGGTEWQTYYHGGDGCFGDAQESDVYGFKGFFAFPVSDFVIRQNEANHDELAPDTQANMSDVTGVYMFWDYSDANTEYTPNQKFYIDNIEFVTDYKVFDSVIYNPPVEETVAAAENGGADAAPAVKVTVPQTGDVTLIFITAAFICMSTAVLIIRKKVQR